jgi:hypothetical protein
MGSTISLPAKGGSLEVDWEVATVTVPITQVELVFNAETREACCINPVEMGRKGTFSLPVSDSGWIALRVRGRYPDQKEIITAHSSPVYVRVEGKPCLNHQDALTILEQIEGAKAYLSTIGTRAESATFKKLLMVLSSAHRMLHNQLHQLGQYHRHTPVDDHHLGR